MYIKNFKLFESSLNEIEHLVLLDGTSSSGKSYLCMQLEDQNILAVDSFYNIIFPESDATEKYNNGITLSDIYGKIQDINNNEQLDYETIQSKNPNNDKCRLDNSYTMFESVQYYMMKEAKYGRVWEKGLLDDDGKRVGKNPKYNKIIFDDIQEGVIYFNEYFNLPKVKQVLLYAPLEKMKSNIIKRSKNDPRDTMPFIRDFIFKYKATKDINLSIDKDSIYTKKYLLELLNDDELQKSFYNDDKLDVAKFIYHLGIIDDGEYYITLRENKNYDLILNSKNDVFENIKKINDYLNYQ